MQSIDEATVILKATQETKDVLARALTDFYRYPEGLVRLGLSEGLSENDGYFRFGPDTVCYGRSRLGDGELNPAAPLRDVWRDASVSEGCIRLPFNPSEIIDNLRLERYPHRQLAGWESFLKRLYYLARPMTGRSARQRLQRFHARRSRNLPFPSWPVDTTVENICEAIILLLLESKEMESLPFIWFWPRGNRACILMTHDIETAAGRDFCPTLLDLDDSFGVKAALEVVPEERYHVSSDFIEDIRSRGFEVAVQDLNHDGRLFDDRKEFLRRATRIRDYARQYGAKGFRSAVLYRKPEWYDALGVSYDMSMPNVAHLDPQLGGCCTVMPYFIGKTLEIPVTTIQDYSLFYLLNERSIDLWTTQVERILAKNGLASFIVHPDYIIDRDTRRVYEELLTYLQGLRDTMPLWFALPREIDAWWRARSQMSIVKDGDSWRIEGEGSENAVLAFAKSVNGRLTYQFADATAGCESRQTTSQRHTATTPGRPSPFTLQQCPSL